MLRLSLEPLREAQVAGSAPRALTSEGGIGRDLPADRTYSPLETLHF